MALVGAALLAPTLFSADWRPLYDGKSLKGWKESDFFGAGDPLRARPLDGAAALPQGRRVGDRSSRGVVV